MNSTILSHGLPDIGGNYYITVTLLNEAENKIRIMNVFCLHSASFQT